MPSLKPSLAWLVCLAIPCNALQGLDDAAKNSQTGVKAFGKATAQGTKDITKGLAGFAMQVGKGDTNFKTLNSVVDITANALAGMAKAIPFAGEAVAAGLKAAAEGAELYAKANEAADAAASSGRGGALTSGVDDDLFDDEE